MAIDACVSQYASVCSLSVNVLKLSASSCTNPVVPTRSTSAEFSAPTAHVKTKNSAVRKVPPRPSMLSRVSQWWGRLPPAHPPPRPDSSPPPPLPPPPPHPPHHPP